MPAGGLGSSLGRLRVTEVQQWLASASPAERAALGIEATEKALPGYSRRGSDEAAPSRGVSPHTQHTTHAQRCARVPLAPAPPTLLSIVRHTKRIRLFVSVARPQMATHLARLARPWLCLSPEVACSTPTAPTAFKLVAVMLTRILEGTTPPRDTGPVQCASTARCVRCTVSHFSLLLVCHRLPMAV